MFIAVLLIFCLSTLAVDYIDQGRCVSRARFCVCACGRVFIYNTQMSQIGTLSSSALKPLPTPFLIYFPPRCIPLCLSASECSAISPSEGCCCCFGQHSNDLICCLQTRLRVKFLCFRLECASSQLTGKYSIQRLSVNADFNSGKLMIRNYNISPPSAHRIINKSADKL